MSLIWQNKKNLLLITCLYILQGIPQGFSNLMTIVLISAKSSYKDIAFFSITYYPYSFKILWSPLVDAFYSSSLGRRRSWIIPTQFLMAFLFLTLSYPSKLGKSLIETMVNENLIRPLTLIFFLLFLSTSTQDVALDAWALKLLPPKIKDLASTCQTAGLNIGNALGYNVVIALTSPSFLHRFVTPRFPSVSQPFSLGTFCFAFGLFAACANFYVAFFVPETDEKLSVKNDGEEYSVVGAYLSLWRMVQIKNIQKFILVAFTSVAPFAANMFLLNSHVVTMRLIHKETLAFLDLLSVPISLCICLIFVTREETQFLIFWCRFFLVKLVVSVLLSISIYLLSDLGLDGNERFLVLRSYYGLHILFSSLDKVLFILFFAFCARICDETYGGTYLTFLAVNYNFGHIWV